MMRTASEWDALNHANRRLISKRRRRRIGRVLQRVLHGAEDWLEDWVSLWLI